MSETPDFDLDDLDAESHERGSMGGSVGDPRSDSLIESEVEPNAEKDGDEGPPEEDIQPPSELDGPMGEVALDAMRQQHESIMQALRNIRA